MTEQAASAPAAVTEHKAPGFTIAQKLIAGFLGVIVLLSVLLIVIYQHYVPPLMRHQIELRVESVARSFASAAFKPIVERNHVQVNKLAEATAQLPDVAYAAAINNRGIAVAGVFGNTKLFDPSFADLVRQSGFPKEIVEKTRLADGRDSARTEFTIGGQEIMNYALRLPDTDSVVHVGLFTDKVNAAVQATLYPLLALLGGMAVVGTIALMLVARTVSHPIHLLSQQAEAISMGQLTHEIDIKAGGEIWLLAESFKRMQASIRYSVAQMRRHQQKQ